MNDFLSILTHTRRLQAATKELSISEIKEVRSKLKMIIEKREIEEKKLAQAQQQKLAEIERIKAEIQAAGLDVNDFITSLDSKKTQRKTTGTKRPVKYVISVAGKETRWTGVGRMPRVFAEAIANGQDLSTFAI